MSTTSYPTKYKNLLIEAGLIGVGEKVIKALVSGDKRVTLDEQSDTWIPSEEYEIDFRGAAEYFSPVVMPGDIIAGDWRKGLDSEQIKRIQEDCSVPVFDAGSMIYVYDGKRYDLSNPAHMAEYRIVQWGGIIANNRQALQAGQRFYFVSTEEVERQKREKRERKMEAALLVNSLDTEEKRQLLEIANWRYKLGFPNSFTEQQVRETFADMALGDHYRQVLDVYNLPNKRFYVLLYSCLDHGLLVTSGEAGPVSYPGSKDNLAPDHEMFIAYLMRDKELYNNLKNRLDATLHANRFDSVILPDKVKLVRHYDTVIHEEGDVRYWGIAACKQYVSEQGWTPRISDADGVEKWRKLVLDIYNSRESPFGFLPRPNIDFTESEPLKMGNLKDWFLKKVDAMKREECINFLKENEGIAREKFFEVQLSPESSTAKWRQTVKDFINLLDVEEVKEILTISPVEA